MPRDLYARFRPKGCEAADPRTCRYHGQAAQAKWDFFQDVKSQQEEAEADQFHQHVLNDIATSLNLKQQKDGSWTATVYRAGEPTPPTERGVEKAVYAHADRYAPPGRQGRTSGVFASPTLGGVARWVKGISDVYPRVDVRVRKIVINPDTTYIYPVNAWERVSWFSGEWSERNTEEARNYWASGVTLTEWVNRVKAGEKLNPADWEMLLPPDVAEDDLNAKQGVKIVPPKTVADQAYQRYLEPKEVYETLKAYALRARQLQTA